MQVSYLILQRYNIVVVVWLVQFAFSSSKMQFPEQTKIALKYWTISLCRRRMIFLLELKSILVNCLLYTLHSSKVTAPHFVQISPTLLAFFILTIHTIGPMHGDTEKLLSDYSLAIFIYWVIFSPVILKRAGPFQLADFLHFVSSRHRLNQRR